MNAEAAPSADPPADPEVLAVLGRGAGNKTRLRRLLRWAVALGVLGGLGFGAKTLLDARREAARPVWKTMPVERTDIVVTVSATGTLSGLNTVEVGSEVSGIVTKVLVDYNDRVTAGQVLAVLDPEQSKAAVDEARAQVASADAAIHEAKATLLEARRKEERAKGQLEAGLVSQQDYEALEAAMLRGEAALASATARATLSRAQLKSAESRLTKTTIHSPIDGIVLARLIEAGQTVAASMTTPVLFKIAQDLRKMHLSVAIDEADVGRVREGQEARFLVDAYPDRHFSSRVLSLRNEPVVQQNVVTYEAILAVDNEELLLRPGMTAAATIVIETKSQVLGVPNAALRFAPPEELQKELRVPGLGPRKPKVGAERTSEVWVLEGNVPRKVTAATGRTDGAFTELVGAELAEGRAVIVDVEQKK